VISILEDYINFIKPSKTVFIAFDGVAPFAKIMQQRSRRWRVSAGAGVSAPAQEWSTLMITPGTAFMEMLSTEITRHFDSGAGEAHRRRRTIVSTSNDRGEGEHKLFEHMRTHIQPNENVVVYGLDADLIMLSLNHLYMGNQITIFREKMDMVGGAAAREEEPYTFVDINFLSHQINRVCGANPSDYIFLCFLLGNDFLPHFPALNLRKNGMDILLETYKKHGSPILVNQGKIQWRNIRAILLELAEKEEKIFIEEDIKRAKLERRLSQAKLTDQERELNRPILYREYEKYICPHEEGWETRYYRVLFGVEADAEPKFGAGEEVAREYIKGVCLNYLEGLEWTLKYYNGVCPHWKWSYKYHYPPLLKDLVKYIPYFETEFFVDAPGESYSPLVQLAAVLPPQYYHYSQNHKLLSKILHDLGGAPAPAHPPRLIWSYCRYDWEAHVDLPEITTYTMDIWEQRRRESI
jgi:5'-3' exonuclease